MGLYARGFLVLAAAAVCMVETTANHRVKDFDPNHSFLRGLKAISRGMDKPEKTRNFQRHLRTKDGTQQVNARDLQQPDICIAGQIPVDLVLLFDESGSMGEEQAAAAAGAAGLFEALQTYTSGASNVGLVGFGRTGDTTADRIRDLSSGYVDNVADLSTALDSLVTAGGFEEGYEALRDMFTPASGTLTTFGSSNPICAVIFTDEDSDGPTTAAQVLAAKGSNAIVPVINDDGQQFQGSGGAISGTTNFNYPPVSSLAGSPNYINLDAFTANPDSFYGRIVGSCVQILTPCTACQSNADCTGVSVEQCFESQCQDGLCTPVKVGCPPDPQDDSATTPEDTPVTINVANNDLDPDNNLVPSTVMPVTNPTSGTVVNNSEGSFLYTPNANFNGQDSFVYQICDEDNYCKEATVIVEVIPVNDPPIAEDDSDSTPEDTQVNVTVLANDSDPDDILDPSSVAITSNPLNGAAVANPDGTITYTPNPNFNGIDTYEYQVCDPDGECDTATVTITVISQVDPPNAENDSATTTEETLVTINVVDNDSDPDGNLDPNSATVTSGPASGVLQNNGDGTFDYTPSTDFSGTDSFVYNICDTDNLCDTAMVTVTVNNVDDPPVAMDDNAVTPEDTPVTINVEANDSDADDDLVPESAEVVTGPLNGNVVNNNDGSFKYTPNANFNGIDSFTYKIFDSSGAFDTATVTITVNAENDPPIAEDDSDSMPEDRPVTVNVADNDSDPDDNLDTSTVEVTFGPANGTAVVEMDGTITYTPDTNFNGEDSLDYKICDSDGLCAFATLTVMVTDVNDPPVANDDNAETEEEAPVNVNVLANDSDPDDPLDPTSVEVTSFPTSGTAVVESDGTITYTPDPNFNGEDNLIYKICDPSGDCDTATLIITVADVNDPPIANFDTVSTDEDTIVNIPVLTNDSDQDGNLDPLTLKVTSGPGDGTVMINLDGTIDYTPNPNTFGQDSFIYEICDDDGDCASAVVTVMVYPVNDLPVAVDDSVTTPEDTPISIPVLMNDYDPDGNITSVNIASYPTNGDVSVDSSRVITYTPHASYYGPDSFTYTVCDSEGLCDTATVNVMVTPVNDPPVAEHDSATTKEGTLVNINVADNDSDPEGNLDPLSTVVITGPMNGNVVKKDDGSFDYTPNPDFNGVDSFTYNIFDADGDSATATVTITVNECDTAADCDDSLWCNGKETCGEGGLCQAGPWPFYWKCGKALFLCGIPRENLRQQGNGMLIGDEQVCNTGAVDTIIDLPYPDCGGYELPDQCPEVTNKNGKKKQYGLSNYGHVSCSGNSDQGAPGQGGSGNDSVHGGAGQGGSGGSGQWLGSGGAGSGSGFGGNGDGSFCWKTDV